MFSILKELLIVSEMINVQHFNKVTS